MQKQYCAWCFKRIIEERSLLEHCFLKGIFCFECQEKLQPGLYKSKIKNFSFYYQYPYSEESDNLYQYLWKKKDSYILQHLLHPFILFYFADRFFLPMPEKAEVVRFFAGNPNTYILKTNDVWYWDDLLFFDHKSKGIYLLDEEALSGKSVLLFALRFDLDAVFWRLCEYLDSVSKSLSVFSLFQNKK